MGISKGTVLGTYVILESVGAGGMGEVYRAQDSKLGREVAIKVLPESFAADSERLSRFEREAQLLASLNHPNVAAIYDLAESSGTRFLVLEFVPGETLAETVGRGRVPVEQAVAICRQIAEALEAAHEKGIVHRDLKPSNVKLTPEGKVKVLDFGLAKLVEPNSTPASFSQSPTLTARGTVEGVILGTAAYMSPEQARGKEVDRRTDIWAFGCVLFELLTGHLAFTGETVTDVFAAIVRGEPDWNQLPASTPQNLRLLLRRCFQKDPRARFQHIGDVRIALDETNLEPVITGSEASGTKRRGPVLWITATIVLLAASVVLSVGFGVMYRSIRPPAVIRFFVHAPDKMSFEQGNVAAGQGFILPAISPDGSRIAFTAVDAAGKSLLWVQPLDSLIAQAFPGTDGAALPFWSPDSRSIGFFAQGRLKKVDVVGGPPQALADASNPRGGTWNRDGVIVFAPLNNGALRRVSSGGGDDVLVTKLPQGLSHRSPWFLPGGRRFLYYAQTAGTLGGIYVETLDGADAKRLVSADSGAVYAPTGDLLFVRQGILLRQAFDLTKLEMRGDPVPIAEGVRVLNNVGSFSVSDNGVLIYRTGPNDQEAQLTWMDRTGKVIDTVGAPGPYQGLSLSPDGKRLAVHRHEANGGDIWIFESSRGPMPRLTFDAAQENSGPVWSPDGKWIAFGSQRNGKWGLYRKLSNGTGGDELLFESEGTKIPMSWSTDDKFLVFFQLSSNNSADQYIFPLTGDKKPVAFLASQFAEPVSGISPDGKWVAYMSNETGRQEIFVRPFPTGEGKRQLSVSGGAFPRWRRDSKELFFVAGAKMFSVKISSSGSTLNSETPVELFDVGVFNSSHTSPPIPFDVSPDGQRFIVSRSISYSSENPASIPITVILNWPASLKR